MDDLGYHYFWKHPNVTQVKLLVGYMCVEKSAVLALPILGEMYVLRLQLSTHKVDIRWDVGYIRQIPRSTQRGCPGIRRSPSRCAKHGIDAIPIPGSFRRP